MKKIITLNDDDVIDGMTEDINRIIKNTFIFAFCGLSIIHAVLIYFSGLVIADNSHKIFSYMILTVLYLFSVLSIKSYMMIQRGMIRKITKLQTLEEEENGTT